MNLTDGVMDTYWFDASYQVINHIPQVTVVLKGKSYECFTGSLMVGHECESVEELDELINDLIVELEGIRTSGRKMLGKAPTPSSTLPPSV